MFFGNVGNSLLVVIIGQDCFLVILYLLCNGYMVSGGNFGLVMYFFDGMCVIFMWNNFVDGMCQIFFSGMQLVLFQVMVSVSGEWIDVCLFLFNGLEFFIGYVIFIFDGRGIYFVFDCFDGFGGYDIYVFYLVGNFWSILENLGLVVNFLGNELMFFFDDVNLFFFFDWYYGLGGLDVFCLQQENGCWIQIFYMGVVINLFCDDYGYVFDDVCNLGYVISNCIGGSGNEDIYCVICFVDNVMLVIKNVFDGSFLVNVIVDFVECGEGVYQVSFEGLYFFQVMQGLNCNLVICKDGYFSVMVFLVIFGNGE